MSPEPDETVTLHAVTIAPEEGEWYYVQAWRKDDGPYSYTFNNTNQWRQYGLGALTLKGVLQSYTEAKEVYAKVRIVKQTKVVLAEDGLS